MNNIQASLAKHGLNKILNMNDLVKYTMMLAEIKDWPALNSPEVLHINIPLTADLSIEIIIGSDKNGG
jgi:hypothetical protein